MLTEPAKPLLHAGAHKRDQQRTVQSITQNSVSQLPSLMSAFSPNGGYNANNLNNSLAIAPIVINK
jgi:hypothetical protein